MKFCSDLFFFFDIGVAMACLFIVFMTLKTSIQNISKRSHMICSNFAIIEATKVGYKNASYL